MILSPSHMKIVYATPFMDFWNGLGQAGGYNLGISIIGFSLPEHDDYIKISLYKMIGNYDLQYSLAADYDFLLRSLSADVKMYSTDSILSFYRNTGLSAASPATVLNEMLLVNRRNFSFFSTEHIRFLIFLYAKNMALIGIVKVLSVFGERTLNSLKRFYTKKFRAR